MENQIKTFHVSCSHTKMVIGVFFVEALFVLTSHHLSVILSCLMIVACKFVIMEIFLISTFPATSTWTQHNINYYLYSSK